MDAFPSFDARELQFYAAERPRLVAVGITDYDAQSLELSRRWASVRSTRVFQDPNPNVPAIAVDLSVPPAAAPAVAPVAPVAPVPVAHVAPAAPVPVALAAPVLPVVAPPVALVAPVAPPDALPGPAVPEPAVSDPVADVAAPLSSADASGFRLRRLPSGQDVLVDDVRKLREELRISKERADALQNQMDSMAPPLVPAAVVRNFVTNFKKRTLQQMCEDKNLQGTGRKMELIDRVMENYTQ
jgi:hypothetical protein